MIWFKRKRYGYGWVPATWQGWVTLLVYVGALFALSLNVDEDPSLGQAIPFLSSVLILTLLLLVICYTKGEKPRWQWGNDKDDTESSA
ncbi:MAG: hypothetical protein AAB381_03135 [Patescibacteria group bacterium]